MFHKEGQSGSVFRGAFVEWNVITSKYRKDTIKSIRGYFGLADRADTSMRNPAVIRLTKKRKLTV